MDKTFEQPKISYNLVKCSLEHYTDKFTGVINHAGTSNFNAIVDGIVENRPYLDAPTVEMIISQLGQEIIS